MTDANPRDLIQRLADALAEWRLGGAPPEDTADADLIKEAEAYLAQPEPEGPTDEEIMDLMPQLMHEDLASAARAMAAQAGTDNRNVAGMMRIILNHHAVDFVRAVLARWGRAAVEPPAKPAHNTAQ